MIIISKATLRLVVLAAFIAVPLTSPAQQTGEMVFIEEPVDGDLYAAGGEIEILAPVSGDAVIAGGTIRISGRVDGDVITAGGNLRLLGNVTDDVRVAGGRIAIEGSVAGHAVAAGGDVHITSNARIEDFAWIAGGKLKIAGTVGSDLRAAGGEIIISGRIDGNVELVGDKIQIEDSAVINGNLTWSSLNEPQISEAAEIVGEISARELDDYGWEYETEDAAWFGGIFTLITLTLTAGILFSIFPAWSNQVASSARERPIASPLVGLAVIATTPLVIIILFMTGVGSMLGLLMLLGYGVTLLLGWLFGLIIAAIQLMSFAGKEPVTTHKMAWLGILLVAILTVLIGGIPVLGFIFVCLILLYGIGTLALDTYRRFRNQ